MPKPDDAVLAAKEINDAVDMVFKARLDDNNIATIIRKHMKPEVTERTPLPKLPWPGPFKVVTYHTVPVLQYCIEDGDGIIAISRLAGLIKSEVNSLCAALNAAWEAEKGGE